MAKRDPFTPDDRKRYHRPRAYRYRVAPGAPRAMWNKSFGFTIGVAVVIGQYAYCLKWADSIPGPMVGSPNHRG